MTENEPYPLRGTRAQQMLESAMKVAQERGRSQRELAAAMGYKLSVVLSHMTSGRVPIPIERARTIAQVLGLDPDQFLLAVLDQRHPDVDFKKLFNVTFSSDRVLRQLEAVAGSSLDDLPAETKDVMVEVVNARQPRRRWLSATEMPVIELIRTLRPESGTRGLSHEDLTAIDRALRK